MNTSSTIHSETAGNGRVDKVTRYGWVIQDSPGKFSMIKKNLICIPDEYQRDLQESKVKEITSSWSWFGCGAIVVAHRAGKYFAVDGQHRVVSAMRRSDIDELPCMVFESTGIVDEAKAFLTVNTGRKPVTAIGKLKALAVSEDPLASFVVSEIDRLGLTIKKTALRPMEIKCISICQKLAKSNKASFVAALELSAILSKSNGAPVTEKILSGLYYFDTNVEFGLTDARLRRRIIDLGAHALLGAANKAGAYFACGGSKVWADGMLTLVNKGMRNRFEFSNATE